MKKKSRDRAARWLLAYVLALLAATFWPYNFFPPNNISWEPGGGLRFSEPSIAYTKPFISGLHEVSEFTLLVHFAADLPGQSSWILSHGVDFNEKNLLVGLYVDQLVVELTRGRRNLQATLKGVLERGKPTWLGVVFDGKALSIYLDGVKRKMVRRRFQDSTWHMSYPLVLGARADGKYPWSGVFYRLALVGIPATESDMGDPESFLSGTDRLLDYRFGSENRNVANDGRIGSGPVMIPERFQPYQRAIPLTIEELWNPPPIWSDIILNILGFIPVGFLLAALLRPKLGVVPTVLIVLLVSFVFSLSIEFLQAFVPKRWSTLTDVITNSAGGLFGAGLLAAVWGKGIARRIGFANDE